MRLTKYNNPERQKKIKERVNNPKIENIRKKDLYLRNYNQYNSSLNQNESKENSEDFLSYDENNKKQIKNKSNKLKPKNINTNNEQKNISHISSDENASNNRINVKKSPHLIYNKIQHKTPIKKEIKLYQIKNSFKRNNDSLDEDIIFQDNNILQNKKKNIYLYNSPSSPYLFNKNKTPYKICPQREINIEYIQQDIYNFNNNYYNNNFYKINKTQSNFYNNKDKNNVYHNIKYSKKTNERDISPISNNSRQYSEINDNDFHNKTIDNYYMHKKINRSNIYEKDNYIRNNSINKYNNHKVTEIVYTNKNNKRNNSQNKIIYFNANNLQEEEYTERSDIYKDISDNCNYKINYINNSNKKKNIIKIMKNKEDINESNDNIEENKNTKGHLKKNNSVFINEIIPYNINNFSINENNKKKHINSNLTEVFDNNNFNKDFSFKKNPFVGNINNSYKKLNIIKNENLNKEELGLNKILIKKRPLKERTNSQNLLTEFTKIKYKIKPKENDNKIFTICQNISFNYEQINNNKMTFDNEDNIIEYINKKFEEEKKKTYFNRKIKFTGFILTKKYKGKNLYDIRIEDDLDKINQKLKDENVLVNNELVQICPYNNKTENDQNNLKNKINNLEKEILKYKEENELLCKKDNMKNILIKKLDKENQNLIDEIKKVSNELEKEKTLNSKYQQLKPRNIELKKNEIENILSILIENKDKKRIFDNKKLNEEKIEINYINKNSDNSNRISLNNNISDGGIGNESKKNNIFRLSKISEIKENRIDNNNDSKDTVIKNNIAMLDEKLDNNNGEYLHENNEE